MTQAWRRVALDQVDLLAEEHPDDLLALDEALAKLSREDPAAGELLKLRFFSGLTLAEAAAALGMARRTADRSWAFARSWLYDELRRRDPGPDGPCGAPGPPTEH